MRSYLTAAVFFVLATLTIFTTAAPASGGNGNKSPTSSPSPPPGEDYEISVGINRKGTESEHWALLVHAQGQPSAGLLFDAVTLGWSGSGPLKLRESAIGNVIHKMENWEITTVGVAKDYGDAMTDAGPAIQAAYSAKMTKAPPAQNCVDFVMLGLDALANKKIVSSSDVATFKTKWSPESIEEIRQRTKGAFKPSTGKPGDKSGSGKPSTSKPISGKPSTGKPISGKPSTGKPISGKPATGKPISGKPATKPVGKK